MNNLINFLKRLFRSGKTKCQQGDHKWSKDGFQTEYTPLWYKTNKTKECKRCGTKWI